VSQIARILGEKIKSLRVERDLSQEQLSLKADINKSFMGEIERGTRSPTVKTLEKVVNALGISFEELFSFGGESLQKEELECVEKIVLELETRSKKEQEAVYKLMKTFLTLLDQNSD
jgi:transcriptional regulator with XRE-family HTH domain